MKKESIFIQKAVINFKNDYNFLMNNQLRLRDRVQTLFEKYPAIIRRKKKISYFGFDFHYDNLWTPTLLQSYPNEVLTLFDYIPKSGIKNVFDVGANIGQFSRTILGLLPEIKVYSFEPNAAPFTLLQKNKAHFPRLNVFNFGIGSQTQSKELFFVKDKSAQGSLYKNNAVIGLDQQNVNVVQVDIRCMSDNELKKNKLPQKVDLLKVDVEGAEVDVLQGMRDVDFNYLYMECSNNREGHLKIDDLISLLKKHFTNKTPIILYQSPIRDTVYDVIIKMNDINNG